MADDNRYYSTLTGGMFTASAVSNITAQIPSEDNVKDLDIAKLLTFADVVKKPKDYTAVKTKVRGFFDAKNCSDLEDIIQLQTLYGSEKITGLKLDLQAAVKPREVTGLGTVAAPVLQGQEQEPDQLLNNIIQKLREDKSRGMQEFLSTIIPIKQKLLTALNQQPNLLGWLKNTLPHANNNYALLISVIKWASEQVTAPTTEDIEDNYQQDSI